ncbi:MAG: VOC family protein [Anaerolineae bacterium]
MTQILNVAEAVLYVQDMEKARRFYEKVLGLPVTYAFSDSCFLQTGPDSTLILFEIETLEQRESVIPAHGARGRGHVALAIPTEELDAWRQQLLAHNVEIEHEQVWPLGTRSIYFRDPDENSVELIDGRHYSLVWEKLTGENPA